MEADEGKETQQKEKDLARLVELLTDKNWIVAIQSDFLQTEIHFGIYMNFHDFLYVIVCY